MSAKGDLSIGTVCHRDPRYASALDSTLLGEARSPRPATRRRAWRYTFNTRSQAFYAARGYHEAGPYPDEEWNSRLTTVLLVKALG